MRIGLVGIAALASVAWLAGCAAEEEIAEASATGAEVVAEAPVAESELPRKIEHDGFAGVLADAGPVYIAGQPTEAALEEMRAEGVGTVINLRTVAEMSNAGVTAAIEAERAAALGMTYVQIEQGPEGTVTPASLDAFADAMSTAEGKVLVHCGSGVRASHMWAAYQVRENGMSMEDALEEARAMNLRSEDPVRALLGMESAETD